MDAIRKKMQSLKNETDHLLANIDKFEANKVAADKEADKHDCDIRDLGKKITNCESEFDETNDKLVKNLESLEEKEKAYKTAEEEVSALSRRIMLMEEEAKKSDTSLASTVTQLALASKEADGILKKVKYFEGKTMKVNEIEPSYSTCPFHQATYKFHAQIHVMGKF